MLPDRLELLGGGDQAEEPRLLERVVPGPDLVDGPAKRLGEPARVRGHARHGPRPRGERK